MSHFTSRAHPWVVSAGLAACALWASLAHAHGMSESSRAAMTEGGLLDYVWLGAEHMVTGYDHLLFLFGVIFFLKGVRDIVRFITAFTLGHCITLLGATLMGITANAWLIDAVIALSVIYKGFENLDGFERVLKVKVPDLLVMVFVFGLIHGFGLSTRLQELQLGDDGIVMRILAFNVGVELGQIAALTVMLGFFALWRSSKTFERFARAANVLLCLAGSGLLVYQIAGYAGLMEDEGGHHHGDGHHDDGHHEEVGHDHGDGHHDDGHHEEVGHDHADKVGHDHADKVGHDHADKVGHDHEEVGHDHADKVGHDHADKVGHDHGDGHHDDGHHEEVGHDHADKVGHDHADKVGHDHADKVGHDHAHKVGHDHADKVGHDHAHKAEGAEPDPAEGAEPEPAEDAHEHPHEHGDHKH